jgi:transcriptional regulator with XRE-family HTH domain
MTRSTAQDQLSGRPRVDDRVGSTRALPVTNFSVLHEVIATPGSRRVVRSLAVASAEGDGQGPSRPVRAARRRAVSEGANPTVRQRELGIRLRELRSGLGLTVEEVGEQLLCSATKISRLETGTRRASLRDVRDLCRIYEVTDPAQEDELMKLASQAREPGWWTQYDEPLLSPLLGLEQEAVAITSFSMYYVPALLQTVDYARAITRGVERKMDPEILEQRVEARMKRQQLLERPAPPRYRALLDEAVLRRQVGGTAVMQAQLDKILKCAEEEKAAIQVIPFVAGVHASTDSNFTFLEFGQNLQQGPVVFVEGLFTNRYQERPAEIDRYREAIEYLRDGALSPRDSTSLITEIRSSHEASSA